MTSYKVIQPTEGESLFEAYLSVLVEILGQENIYRVINKYIPVIKIDFSYRDKPWKDPETYGIDKFIFYLGEKFNETAITETHFMVATKSVKYFRGRLQFKWEIHDPHHHFQKYGSHGFCQMFAHFMANEKTIGFIDISFSNIQNIRKDIYILNTFRCLRKTLRLINRKHNLYNQMEELFMEIKNNKVERIYFGIQKKSFKRFIFELSSFTIKDVSEYIDDLY